MSAQLCWRSHSRPSSQPRSSISRECLKKLREVRALGSLRGSTVQDPDHIPVTGHEAEEQVLLAARAARDRHDDVLEFGRPAVLTGCGKASTTVGLLSAQLLEKPQLNWRTVGHYVVVPAVVDACHTGPF